MCFESYNPFNYLNKSHNINIYVVRLKEHLYGHFNSQIWIEIISLQIDFEVVGAIYLKFGKSFYMINTWLF